LIVDDEISIVRNQCLHSAGTAMFTAKPSLLYMDVTASTQPYSFSVYEHS